MERLKRLARRCSVCVVAQVGKMLLVLGALLAIVGGLLIVGERLGLGRLPGDFQWKGKSFSVHFPLATSVVVSLLLTLLVNWWMGRSR